MGKDYEVSLILQNGGKIRSLGRFYVWFVQTLGHSGITPKNSQRMEKKK